MVLKPSGNLEIISYCDSLKGFSVICAKTFLTRKNFPGSNATLLPRFLRLWGGGYEDDEDANVENIDFVQVVVFQGLAISGNFLAENLTFPSVLQFRCFYLSTLCHLEYISNKYSEYFQTNICPGVEQTLDFGFFIISIQIFCIVMDITIQGTEEGGIRLERGTLNYRTGTTYIKIRPPLSAVMMII